MKTYSEKLKDPRWQRKRLEVMQRANWRCELCGDPLSTLHVHHLGYERGKEPWEHEDLACLCEHHHDMAHGFPPKAEETSSLILAWRVATAEGQRLGVSYVDPLPFMLEIDAARGNQDAIEILAWLQRKAA